MIGKGWKTSCKKGRNVRGKKIVMTADHELNNGNENSGRAVEKVMDIDQKDELVVMLEYTEGEAKKKTEKNKLASISESVEGRTKKTAGIQ